MRALVILLVSLTAVAAGPQGESRIAGGTVTTISQYPFAAVLLHNFNANTWRETCAGTILNFRSILSAAHCFRASTTNQARFWRVRVGSSSSNFGGTVHNANNIINHPSYNIATFDNDVAILRVAQIQWVTGAVQPASIAGSSYNLGDNQLVMAIGWGRVGPQGFQSQALRHVQLRTVNQNICAQRYAELRGTITANMLCAGWLDVGIRDQCSGDNGAPLLHGRVVVGVYSFGECGAPRWPSVNTRVSRVSNWIINNA